MSLPQSFVDWEVVHLRVAESLGVAAEQLDPRWAGIASQSAKDATGELRRIFILKGYSVEHIGRWDDREFYASRLAAFFAFARGTALCAYDLKSVEWLDPRKELAEAGALVIGGVAVAPAAGESEVGGCSSGSVSAVAEEICRAERRFR